MNMHIRARVLIPTLLFMAIAIPAILVPTITAQQAEQSANTQHNTDAADPMQWGIDHNPYDSEWQLSPEEVKECLECYLGE